MLLKVCRFSIPQKIQSLCRNCKKFCETYNCTDHRAIKFALEVPYQTLSTVVGTTGKFRKGISKKRTELMKRLSVVPTLFY